MEDKITLVSMFEANGHELERELENLVCASRCSQDSKRGYEHIECYV